MALGTQLRQIRQIRKQTLADVAAATHLSISYISNIERNKAEPTLDNLRKLAGHFDMPVAQFLTESDKAPTVSQSIHPASFRGFIEQMNGRVDTAMQDLLLRIDAQAEKPAKSVDDWMQYYYVVSAIITSR